MCSYAKKDLESAHTARDESTAMVEKLTRRNDELESSLRQAEERLQKVSNALAMQQDSTLGADARVQELERRHIELSMTLSKETEEKTDTQRAWQESQAAVEQLAAKVSQERRETEAVLAKLSKVCLEKDEALRQLRKVEAQLSKPDEASEHRQNNESGEQAFEASQQADSNKQIHDLQVQGVQLAQAKVFLEEKIDRLTQIHDNEKKSLMQNVRESRSRVAEMEAQCAASLQREGELVRSKQYLEAAVEQAKRPDSERQREDGRRDQSIADLESRLNEMRSELTQRDTQICKLQEALTNTRSMVAKSRSPQPNIEARNRDELSPSNSLTSSPQESEGLSPGRILPFGQDSTHFSMSASTLASMHQDDVEVKMPTPFQARALRSASLPSAQVGSPMSPGSPLGSLWGIDTFKGSTQASRGSAISPPESLMASFTTIGNRDSVQGFGVRSVSPHRTESTGMRSGSPLPVHRTESTAPRSQLKLCFYGSKRVLLVFFS